MQKKVIQWVGTVVSKPVRSSVVQTFFFSAPSPTKIFLVLVLLFPRIAEPFMNRLSVGK